MIRVDGTVTLKHFMLTKPDKIVVDSTGATLGVPAGDAYDGVSRGGITRDSLFTVHEERSFASCSRSMRRIPTTSRSRTAKCASASTAAPRSSSPGRSSGGDARGSRRRGRSAARAAAHVAGRAGASSASRSGGQLEVEPRHARTARRKLVPHAVAGAAHHGQLGERVDQRRARRLRRVHRPHDSSVEERHRNRHGEHHQPAVGRRAPKES